MGLLSLILDEKEVLGFVDFVCGDGLQWLWLL
jgi:hypothetical protein